MVNHIKKSLHTSKMISPTFKKSWDHSAPTRHQKKDTQIFTLTEYGIGRSERMGVIKINEAVIPLADVAEITASDESLLNKNKWKGC